MMQIWNQLQDQKLFLLEGSASWEPHALNENAVKAPFSKNSKGMVRFLYTENPQYQRFYASLLSYNHKKIKLNIEI